MFLLACLLLGSVSVGHTLIAATKAPRHGCRSSDLSLIQSYFEATAIERGDSTQLAYCITNKTSEELRKPPIGLSQVVDLYKSLDENVHEYADYNPEGPFTGGSVLLINGSQQALPLWQEADIRSSHLAHANSYPEYGDNVTKQMELMGARRSDDRGYLLPHSLGGPSTPLNMIPMARNVNRHLSFVPEDCGLGRPRANWRSHENWIRRFLLHDYPKGRVAWRLAVQYEDSVFTDLGRGSYRPLSFSFQYHAYTNENDGNSVYYISPQMTFLNENDFSCQDDAVYQRREKIIVPSNCTVSVTKAGRMGAQVSKGKWETRHVVSFPWNIQGKTYIYGQSAGDEQQKFRWFIQEILDSGEMGKEVSSGYWNESYPVSFPYFINGRQYFYAHNVENGHWFIRELLPQGKMGIETSNGLWKYISYPISFPFTINGKHYFYGQQVKENNNLWFIQELLPDGKMGQEISSGARNERHTVVFPYSINNRHMFYAHDPDTKDWFVQELLPEGQLGEILNQGQWKFNYHLSFSYSSGDKYYFYGLNAKGSLRWFISELPPNGKMSREISEGYVSYSCSIAFPFTINNTERYIYQYSNEAKEWKIRKLL